MVNRDRPLFVKVHHHPIRKKIIQSSNEIRDIRIPLLVLVFLIVQKVNVLNIDNYLMLHECLHLKYRIFLMK
jgi:hypothetical protein